jgi:DNA-binding PadR family transcriptional regulator
MYRFPSMDRKEYQCRPISPAVLHILLALSEQALHGYGIIKEVDRQTHGQYRLGPGTLYDNLVKLIEDGLVDDIPPNNEPDSKRMYRLTQSGAGVLSAELIGLESVLRLGRRRLRSLQNAEPA